MLLCYKGNPAPKPTKSDGIAISYWLQLKKVYWKLQIKENPGPPQIVRDKPWSYKVGIHIG